MADKKNNLQSLQNEVEVIKIPKHEVENNGDRAHVQEPNDEDVEETKDEEGHVNEELAQPDIAQWTILLQFLGIDKEPEDIEFSDFNGKEFIKKKIDGVNNGTTNVNEESWNWDIPSLQYLVEVSDGWENVGCMKDDLYYKVEEWEHNWIELLEKYDLANNKWIKDQYKSRGKWADTYLRGHYFGGARATGRCENGIKRKVLISNDHEDVICDCYWFETKSRWLNDAKDMQSTTLGIERRCLHPEVIENSRYSSVTSQTCITSYLASRSQEAFEKAMSVISNLNAELKKIPLDKEFNILDKNEGEFPNNILDSKILKTRGKPTIASSSRSSSQGKDKNKHKSDDRHCAICSGTDHDKRNCPTKPKLTTDSPTKPKLPSKKNDHAKKKMKDFFPTKQILPFQRSLDGPNQYVLSIPIANLNGRF
ncbi:hypothetical protein G4B88_016445 [Cannabis sativa]|uniref:Protein FAR1-RELATED SEQUENCE n=1 Tax=Cannabis sativa TaxID=3483 RepID=A0A7J6FFS8_CANSA|nr:hypothetical protein G4B88_016445 [Cannabis sativa]